METNQKVFIGYGAFMIFLGLLGMIFPPKNIYETMMDKFTIAGMGLIIIIRELTPRKGEF